jgi:predicted RNase H-like HicB family nuclease
MKRSRARFNIVLRPESAGGFTVTVPTLPGCVTYGRTLSEAKTMAKDAISAYIDSLKKRGEPVPADDGTLLVSVSIECNNASSSRRARNKPKFGTMKGRIIIHDPDWWKPMTDKEVEDFIEGRS